VKYFFIFILMLPLSGQVLSATPDTGFPNSPQLILAQARRLTLDEAVELVQRQTGGRILAAESARIDGRDGYKVKVLTSRGDVRIFFIDAESGEIK
jgi:uncharacterized membrane protein YkoI